MKRVGYSFKDDQPNCFHQAIVKIDVEYWVEVTSFRDFLLKKKGSTFLLGITNVNIQHPTGITSLHNQAGVRKP